MDNYKFRWIRVWIDLILTNFSWVCVTLLVNRHSSSEEVEDQVVLSLVLRVTLSRRSFNAVLAYIQ